MLHEIAAYIFAQRFQWRAMPSVEVLLPISTDEVTRKSAVVDQPPYSG